MTDSMRGAAILAPGWPHTANSGRRGRRPQQRWDEQRKESLRRLWAEDIDVESIADQLETSRGAIYQKAHQLGLGRRRTSRTRKPRGFSVQKRDASGQRRFAGHDAPAGEPRVKLAPHHPALREGATIFGTTVKPAAMVERMLKSGQESRKLGKRVTKGRWRDMPIFMLTLEERETCPRTCLEWATCYGNNMHMAERIADDGTLTRRLWGELAALSARNPAGFIVRLHILGDFFSVEYVEFWRQALADFPALRIFGFTARQPSDPIGQSLLHLVRDEGERVALRFSGGGYETHCAEVVDSVENATGILCPAQTSPDRCCATCGLCWATDRTISFLRH